DVKNNQGSVIISNLKPRTNYLQGEFYVSWEGDNYESEKVVVPEFTTLESHYKEITFYAKDILIVNPKTSYNIAVDNGFEGTEEEWVKSIKVEPEEKGNTLKFSDLTEEEKEEIRGKKGDTGDVVYVPPKIYTRDEYNQLETKDNNTLYFISEG